MKLLIAIPCLDYVHTDFMDCLIKLVLRLKEDGVNFEVKILTGTLVYAARNRLAYHAIAYGFTHVLWLDADMIFNSDLLDDIQFSGKDFVTGIAHARRKPFVPCVFRTLDPSFERFEEYPNNTFEVAACGFACVLMTVDVLKQVHISFKTWFTPEGDLGEDIAFCKRARQIGFKIYAEPSVRLGHMAHIPIYPEDYQKYMSEVMEG